jgi:hypothetical protein
LASLGDYFSEEHRNAYSNRSLTIGTVIRSPVIDTTPPKYKFWIIIGLSGDGSELGIVYINTEPNGFIKRSPVLSNLQIKFQKDHRNLVDHDCYANCSEIKRKNAATIQQQLEANPSFVRGVLSPNELNTILAALRSATTISRRDKSRFNIL